MTRLLFLLPRQVHNIYLQSYAVFCIEHHVMTVAFQLFFQGILYLRSTAFGINKPQVLSIHIPLNYTIYFDKKVGDMRMLVTKSWPLTWSFFITNIEVVFGASFKRYRVISGQIFHQHLKLFTNSLRLQHPSPTLKLP